MFKSKPVNHVERLQNQSADTLDIFTQTVNDLQDINADLDNHHAEMTDKKAKLHQDITDLEAIRSKNTAIINKINTILN